MTPNVRPRRHSQRRQIGQALVEFAVIIPIFLTLMYAVIEFGRFIYMVQILNNAAREGARYAIVHGEASFCPSGPVADATKACDIAGANVKAMVRGFAIGVDPSSISFPTLDSAPQSAWIDGTGCRGCRVTIEVSMPFSTLVPIVPLPTVTVKGTATLVINH